MDFLFLFILVCYTSLSSLLSFLVLLLLCFICFSTAAGVLLMCSVLCFVFCSSVFRFCVDLFLSLSILFCFAVPYSCGEIRGPRNAEASRH